MTHLYHLCLLGWGAGGAASSQSREEVTVAHKGDSHSLQGLVAVGNNRFMLCSLWRSGIP